MDRTCAALLRFPDNEIIATTAADLITTLTRQPGTLEVICTPPVAAALLAMIRRNGASVAEHATVATRQLALSEHVAPLLLTEGITSNVVDTLRRYSSKSYLCRNCVSTLAHLVQHAVALPSVVEANAVEAVLSALARHKGMILQRAVGAHEPGAAAAGKKEVVTSLTVCLKDYASDLTFVTNVVRALAHICKVDKGKHGRMVIAAGGIPLMAAAMKRYAADANLVNFAVSGLEWLRADCHDAWVPAAKGELAAAYVTAARAHLNNCSMATSLLFQLVGLTKGSTADIIKAGAAPVMVAGLRKYMDVERTCELVCKSLREVLMTSDTAAALFVSLGAVETVAAVLGKHVRAWEAARVSAEALGLLLVEPAALLRLHGTGAMESVTSVIRFHGSGGTEKRLHCFSAAMRVLARVFTTPTRSVPLTQELVDADIAAAMMRLLAEALEASRDMDESSQSMDVHVARTTITGICATVTDLLTPSEALGAADKLVVSNAVDKLLEAGAPELLAAVLLRFPLHEKTWKFVVVALARLSLPARGCEQALAAGAAKLALCRLWTDDEIDEDSGADYYMHLARLILLRNLTAAPAGRAAVLHADAGALDYIVQMVCVHDDESSSELIAAGCAAMRGLAMSPEYRLPLPGA